MVISLGSPSKMRLSQLTSVCGMRSMGPWVGKPSKSLRGWCLKRIAWGTEGFVHPVRWRRVHMEEEKDRWAGQGHNFGRCCCCSLRKRKKKWPEWSPGSELAPCWETGSWLEGVWCPLWLTCKRCFVAEFYHGFAVCLPCLSFCFSPFPSPFFHFSLSFFLNYFFSACFSSRL